MLTGHDPFLACCAVLHMCTQGPISDASSCRTVSHTGVSRSWAKAQDLHSHERKSPALTSLSRWDDFVESFAVTRGSPMRCPSNQSSLSYPSGDGTMLLLRDSVFKTTAL